MKPEKQLYQWDVNQYLTGINPAAQYVDYTIGNEVIRIKADGTRCRIPDEVLQTYGGKTCYERYPDGTYRAYSFTVLYAPKPPDYVYTAEDRTTFDALVAKADAAIAEIKRRADSGEFTPKKGVDYFTDAEKAEMMESVSDGAIGEFRKVVDTATTEYNVNHTEKMTEYDTNASEKLTTYDTNAEQHTTDYNRNAEVKLEAYNSNHAANVAEYNENAETKTAEFDSNAAALQTEVDRLRGECDTLAAENRKQENRIDALIKLNKGQTYDILPEEGETASRTAPSGAKYAGVDMVGGKSVVWNQLVQDGNFTEASHWTTSNATMTVSNNIGTVIQNNISGYINKGVNTIRGHKCLAMLDIKGVEGKTYAFDGILSNLVADGTWQRRMEIFTASAERTYLVVGQKSGDEFPVEWQIRNTCIFDLTQMFGAGNEPSTAEEFEAMFPADYYPYSEPTIISSQTDRVDVESADGTTSQQITTGFPVLNSAGSAYDYIDINEGKLHQRVGVVDLGTFKFYYYSANVFYIVMPSYMAEKVRWNMICNAYILCKEGIDSPLFVDKSFGGNSGVMNTLWFKNLAYTDATAFKESMNGVMLYYELAEEIITDITIPTELTDWLPVEPGGTVTFKNADESKQLAVPNAVSWVRKLDEVE